MITDAIWDASQAALVWALMLLPAAVLVPGDYGNPATVFGDLANASSGILQGSPFFAINGSLFCLMLIQWLAIDATILLVRCLVWIKKSMLV